jgi:hypothetical protein
MLPRRARLLQLSFLLFIPNPKAIVQPLSVLRLQHIQSDRRSFQSDTAPQSRADTAVELAQKVVDKSIAAYGGEAKIVSFRQATFNYQVEPLEGTNSRPVDVRTYFKDSSQFRSEVKGGDADAITILNRDKGWVIIGGTILPLTRKNLGPLKTAMISQLRPDLLLLTFQKFRFVGKSEEDGQSVNQIDVSGFIGGEYVRGRLSFDAKTSLIYKYQYEIERELQKGKGIVEGEETYIRYSEFAGLQVPAEVHSRQGRKLSRITINKADFLSVLSDDLFKEPSPVAATPTK